MKLSEIEMLKELITATLLKFPEVKVAIMFGSAAEDRLTVQSDVDIAVASNSSLSIEQRLALSAALSNAVKREVDLVDMKSVSGLILQQILTKGVMLRKDAACYAALMKRMLFEQADMMPYTRRVMQAHVERFLHG